MLVPSTTCPKRRGEGKQVTLNPEAFRGVKKKVNFPLASEIFAATILTSVPVFSSGVLETGQIFHGGSVYNRRLDNTAAQTKISFGPIPKQLLTPIPTARIIFEESLSRGSPTQSVSRSVAILVPYGHQI